MGKGRVEAFSDGVIAIIITIMVLDLKVPHGAALADLKPLAPVFLGYVLSFAYVGIYWSNHHHMLHLVRRIDGSVLWANLHLLFWLSTVPFATAWMGENPLRTAPVALYGFVLLASGAAYTILQSRLIRLEGPDGALAKAVAKDRKGKVSIGMYVLGAAAAFFVPLLSLAIYILVACMWVVPDRRIERQLGMGD